MSERRPALDPEIIFPLMTMHNRDKTNIYDIKWDSFIGQIQE